MSTRKNIFDRFEQLTLKTIFHGIKLQTQVSDEIFIIVSRNTQISVGYFSLDRAKISKAIKSSY